MNAKKKHTCMYANKKDTYMHVMKQHICMHAISKETCSLSHDAQTKEREKCAFNEEIDIIRLTRTRMH